MSSEGRSKGSRLFPPSAQEFREAEAGWRSAGRSSPAPQGHNRRNPVASNARLAGSAAPLRRDGSAQARSQEHVGAGGDKVEFLTGVQSSREVVGLGTTERGDNGGRTALGCGRLPDSIGEHVGVDLLLIGIVARENGGDAVDARCGSRVLDNRADAL